MPSLYTKRNDGAWVVPKKVHAKHTDGSWHSCTRVFRKDDNSSGPYGTGWVKHWPPTTMFIGPSQVSVGPYTPAVRDGWTGWTEWRVSEAYRTAYLTHMNQFSMNIYSWWRDRDDNNCNCDGGIYQYTQIQSYMQHQLVSPNIRPIRLGAPFYTGSTGHTAAASSTYLRTSTINVPHNCVLVGFRYNFYYEASGAYSAYEFQLVVAQVLDASHAAIPNSDITHTGGYLSTATASTGINGFYWGGAATAIVPNDYTARAVTFGTGCSGGAYRTQMSITSQRTRIE